MREHPILFRFTTRVALAALLCNAAPAQQVRAQPTEGPSIPPPPVPPLPQPDQSQPGQDQGDPPSRVGRVAAIAGTVSFHTRGDTQWTPAGVNYPVSTGDAYWTEPTAQAHLDVGASRIVLAGKTEFDIATLDANLMQGVAAQGEIYLHLRELAPSEEWTVQTPRGLVHLNGAGRYNIVVGSTEQPTLVTVVDGAADIEGPGVALHMESGQTAIVEGTDDFQGSIEAAGHDAFLTAQLDAERPVSPSPHIPPQIAAQVAAMPGGDVMTIQGDWSQTPEYGAVWYPPVQAGWVPYRDGHWAYVAPWGWTWVDDAPWGFAPSHYGRWVELGGRWAWTPGNRPVAGPPVYAPALVAFLGIGAGLAVGAALAAGHVGWVPLGPKEPYRPWYHASDGYLRSVNNGPVTNVTNNMSVNSFVNRNAATSVPAEAMVGSRPLRSLARPVNAQELAVARPLAGALPLRPTGATAGITPVVARQFNVPQTGLPVAPGPALHAQPPSGSGRPAFDAQTGSRLALPGALPAITAPRTGGGPVVPPGQMPASIRIPTGGQHNSGPAGVGAAVGSPLGGGQPARQASPGIPGPARPVEPGMVHQGPPPGRTQPLVPANVPQSVPPSGARPVPPVNMAPHQEVPHQEAPHRPPAAPMPTGSQPTASGPLPQIQRPTPPAPVARPTPPQVPPAAAAPQREQQHFAAAPAPQHAAPPPPPANRAPEHAEPPGREKRPN